MNNTADTLQGLRHCDWVTNVFAWVSTQIETADAAAFCLYARAQMAPNKAGRPCHQYHGPSGR